MSVKYAGDWKVGVRVASVAKNVRLWFVSVFSRIGFNKTGKCTR